MFDPYHKWLGIPKEQQPPTYFQLLGIQPGERDPEVIDEAAIRQMKHLRDYQIGPQAADCTRLLNEVALARATLLNPAKRREYEAKLAQPAPAPAAKQQITNKPRETPRAADQVTKTPPARVSEPEPRPRRTVKTPDIRKPTPVGLYVGLGVGGVAIAAAIIVVALLKLAPADNKVAANPGPAPVAPPPVIVPPGDKVAAARGDKPAPAADKVIDVVKPPAPIPAPAANPIAITPDNPKPAPPAAIAPKALPPGWGEIKAIETDAGAVIIVVDAQRVVTHRSFSWLMDVDTFEKKKDYGYIGADCAPRGHHGGKVLYSRDKESQCLDLTTGQTVPLPITNPQRLLGLEFSPSGKYIAAHEDNGWKLYDGQKYQQLGHMAGMTGEVHAIAFFKDETRCLVGERRFMHLVELPKLVKIQSWPVADIQVDGIALSPDETTVAFVAQSQFHLFDLAKGAVTRQFPERNTRHPACAFFPDRPWVAFGSGEEIVLWNWRTMTQVARHNFDRREVRQIAITPDGRNMLVHRGSQVQRWKLGPELLK